MVGIRSKNINALFLQCQQVGISWGGCGEVGLSGDSLQCGFGQSGSYERSSDVSGVRQSVVAGVEWNLALGASGLDLSGSGDRSGPWVSQAVGSGAKSVWVSAISVGPHAVTVGGVEGIDFNVGLSVLVQVDALVLEVILELLGGDDSDNLALLAGSLDGDGGFGSGGGSGSWGLSGSSGDKGGERIRVSVRKVMVSDGGDDIEALLLKVEFGGSSWGWGRRIGLGSQSLDGVLGQKRSNQWSWGDQWGRGDVFDGRDSDGGSIWQTIRQSVRYGGIDGDIWLTVLVQIDALVVKIIDELLGGINSDDLALLTGSLDNDSYI